MRSAALVLPEVIDGDMPISDPVRQERFATMDSTRQAVIDIGTNSVKLLVAEARGVQVEPVLEKSWQTRLGKGFYENHCLLPEAIAQTAQAVAEFAGL